MLGENPLNRSAAAVYGLRDMVYSPNKYRETEGVKVRRLGYDLSDARLKATAMQLGIEQSTNSMNQAQKAQLRYYAIMNQVTQAQGDMSRTLSAPANQLRILSAQATMAGRAIGNIFIPILNAILPPAIAVAQAVRAVAAAIASVFGYSLPAVDFSVALDSISTGADNAAGSLGDAAGAAKKLKNYVMGFDELNIIPDTSGGGGGGAGGGGGGSLSGFDFELPDYDFLGDAVNTTVDRIYAKLEPFVNWIIDNLDSVIAVAKAVGGAFLAWKIAGGFVPNLKSGLSILNQMKSVAGALAVTAITMAVVYSVDKQFLESGNAWQLIADGLSTAFGSAISGAAIAATFGKGAGVYGAAVTLALSAGITISTIYGGIVENGLNGRTIVLGIVGLLKGAIAGAMVGAKLGLPVAGALIGAGITLAVELVGVLAGIRENSFNEKLNWGKVELKAGEARERAQDLFTFDVATQINVIDEKLENENVARETLNRSIVAFEANLHKIQLGVDVSPENIAAMATQAQTVITDLTALLTEQQQTIDLAFNIAPATNSEGNDITASLLGATTDASNMLAAGVQDLGEQLSKALSDGMVDGFSEEEQRIVTELSASLSRITRAIETGEMQGSFLGKTTTALKDLTEESFKDVLYEYGSIKDDLEASIRDVGNQALVDMHGQLAGLTEYRNSLGDDPLKFAEITEQIVALEEQIAQFDIVTYVEEAMNAATGPAKQKWMEALQEIFGGAISESISADYFGGFIQSWSEEMLYGGLEFDAEAFASAFNTRLYEALESTIGSDNAKMLVEAGKVIGVTGWDFLSSDVQNELYASLVNAFGSGVANELLFNLGYSIPGMIEDGMAAAGNAVITPEVDAQNVTEEIAAIESEVASATSEIASIGPVFSDSATEVSSAASSAESAVKTAFSGTGNWFANNVSAPIRTSFTGIDWATMGKSAALKLKSGLKSITMPKFTLSWTNASKVFSFAGQSSVVKVPVPNLKFYAQGGFPSMGELFVANEAGPELVGRIGSRTAVANQEQIGDAIFQYMDAHDRENGGMDEERLASAIVRAMRSAGVGSVYLDSRKIAQAINRTAQASGKPAIT